MMFILFFAVQQTTYRTGKLGISLGMYMVEFEARSVNILIV